MQVLVRQALYHIGTLTDDLPPRLLWRTGWEQERDVLPTLCRELAALERAPAPNDSRQAASCVAD